MSIGMPAGISSVVLQAQVFFTLFFAAVFLKESLRKSQKLGVLIAGTGLCLIGGNVGVSGLSSIPAGAFLLTLLAAAFWGISNIIARYASKQAEQKGESLDMLSMVVWSSLIPPVPFFVISLLLDSPETVMHAIRHINAISMFSVLYLSFCATLFGYGVWNRLLARYPAEKLPPYHFLSP